MFYREAGDFKTSYADDNQTFPIAFDRYRYYFVLFVGLAIVPFVINDYWANAILLPFLIYAIAAIGLNILTGYCGQVSLGTGGLHGGGGLYLVQADDGVSVDGHGDCHAPVGVMTAIVGVMFGLPACASRASTWPWRRWRRSSSSSGSSTRCRGSTTTRPRADQRAGTLPVRSGGDRAERGTLGQLPVLLRPALRTGLDGAKPDARVGGRQWMAIRDMDIAAEIIGVNPLKAKLSAFAVSSFYVGISGALFFTVYLGAVEVARPSASRNRSSCSS
jgi:branched-chain amino acid transport system permease protein